MYCRVLKSMSTDVSEVRVASIIRETHRRRPDLWATNLKIFGEYKVRLTRRSPGAGVHPDGL
jgi:hypothetical protein